MKRFILAVNGVAVGGHLSRELSQKQALVVFIVSYSKEKGQKL